VGGRIQLGPLGTAATNRPIVPSPGDYDDGEIGGMIGMGNRSTQRKPSPVPLCPPQTTHAARTRTRTASVGSQRLTAWATSRPWLNVATICKINSVTLITVGEIFIPYILLFVYSQLWTENILALFLPLWEPYVNIKVKNFIDRQHNHSFPCFNTTW
jgi:hypothetical protein